MQVPHEPKRRKENPKVALLSGSATRTRQRLNADPHHFIWEEDKVYQPDWEISTGDLDEYADIWRED